MSQLSALPFEEYVQQVLAEHKGERVYHFTYNDKDFWLKQPEQLHGVWHFLKPKPKQAFKNEIQSLQYLAEHHAPVPHLEMFGEDFLVLEDGGNSVAHWIGLRLSEQQKRAILLDAAVALAGLHRQGLVHGRPAIRDILWRDGQVLFIDFEVNATKRALSKQKARDLLLFIYNLCREDELSDEIICDVMRKYRECCEPQEWLDMLASVEHYRCIYYLLLPFKAIAKRDLIGIYRLYQNIEQVKRED